MEGQLYAKPSPLLETPPNWNPSSHLDLAENAFSSAEKHSLGLIKTSSRTVDLSGTGMKQLKTELDSKRIAPHGRIRLRRRRFRLQFILAPISRQKEARNLPISP